MELSDQHYCDRCYFTTTDTCDSGICRKCEYSVTNGFSNWKPITMKLDNVNKPSHYMLWDNTEVRDVLACLVAKMREKKTPNSVLFESDYVQMMQYLMRFMDKNGKEDLMKARWFLNKLIDAYE
jgi:hypothetical protein